MSLQPAIPWQVALPQSQPPLHRPGSECAKVVLPVENFAANGEHGLNCLCQPRGQPQYIPGVFVERRETKQLCRCFCHPILFFQRSIESVRQLNLISWNRFMDRAGLPALPIPDMSAIPASSNLGDIKVASVKARQSFDPLFAVLKDYKEKGRESQLAASVPAAKKPFYEENAHELRNSLQSLPYYLELIRK